QSHLSASWSARAGPFQSPVSQIPNSLLVISIFSWWLSFLGRPPTHTSAPESHSTTLFCMIFQLLIDRHLLIRHSRNSSDLISNSYLGEDRWDGHQSVSVCVCVCERERERERERE
ncbi:unnamed protein product, partial [Musa textilis]